VYIGEAASTSKSHVNPSLKSIACGEYSSLAITCDGNLYSWGYNKDGCLSHDENEKRIIFPRKIENIPRVVAADAGLKSSYILSSNNDK
jgi:alpha-tubulin suppressor-like RCC1 family protein